MRVRFLSSPFHLARLRFGAWAVVAAVALQAAEPLPPSPAFSLPTRPGERSLTVQGQADVSAPPDEAVLTLGIEVTAKVASAAQDGVNGAMQHILAAVRKLDVPEDEVQTIEISLTPVYTENRMGDGKALLTGFRADNSIQIRVSDFTRVGKVIDAAVAAGANRLQGVSFQLKNDLPARSTALELAIENARRKARAMADALRLRLGIVEEVSEGGTSLRPPQPYLAARAMSVATPVQPGQVGVHASVEVRYRLEDP